MLRSSLAIALAATAAATASADEPFRLHEALNAPDWLTLKGETRDLSRIGARVRVPLTELDLLPQAGLAEISARIGKLFGDLRRAVDRVGLLEDL